LLFFVLKIVGGRAHAGEILPNLIASVFYVHNIAYGAPSVINFVAWSLEIEVQFYILAPAAAFLFAISTPSLRRALLIASVLAATGLSKLVSGHAVLEHSLLANAQYFLAGFLLVEFYLSGGERRQSDWRWDVVSLVGWSTLLALLVEGGSFVGWAAPWLILLLFIAALHGLVMNRFVANPWITTIGGACYTIYLLHNYLISGLGIVTERVFPVYPFAVRLLIQFVLMSPVILAVCAVYFRWIERPCMRPDWPRQLVAAFSRVRSRWRLEPAGAGSLPDE
jgi:peptidoglycan/LPS O-acetylase OafA/YrhL